MTRRYAEGTSVDTVQSRVEIEILLKDHGAACFVYGASTDEERIGCKLNGKSLLWKVKRPDASDARFGHTPTGRERSDTARRNAADSEYKRRWRALLLMIKAKLEALESELETADTLFLGETMLPDGRTVAETVNLQDALGGREIELLPGE